MRAFFFGEGSQYHLGEQVSPFVKPRVDRLSHPLTQVVLTSYRQNADEPSALLSLSTSGLAKISLPNCPTIG